MSPFWITFLLTSFIQAGTPKETNNSRHIRKLQYSKYREILKVTEISRVRTKRDATLQISQHFTETTVTPGADVTLHCLANAEHPSRFVWERDGLIVSSNTDIRYTIGQTMSSDGGVISHLNISHARVEDGGLYACVAQNGESLMSHEDRLNIYGPPYIRTLPPIKAQSGQSITLRCPYYGYPISDLTWEYKGKVITPKIQTNYNKYKREILNIEKTEIFGRKPKLREKRDSNNSNVLIISKVTKSDNGATYACVVKGTSGEMAKRSFEILVVEAPVLEEILLAPNLQEGQIVQIHCNLKSGDSPVYFSWLKDGKMLPTHLKIIERSLELFSVLIVKNVSLEHCGTYTCVAANHVAKVNRTVNLYIKVAPKWKEEPRNSTLLFGKYGHVACSASGYPQPQSHWLKKDVLSESWRPVLEVAGGGVLSLPNGSLIFDKVSMSDAGFYTCHVENGVGEPLSNTIWISVNRPVNFDVTEVKVTVKIGHDVAIDCRAKGDEPIRIMWTRHGKPINPLTQRLKISEAITDEGVTSILEILQAEADDAAIYQCRAGNPFGAAVYTVNLIIIEPPSPPVDLSIDSVKRRSVRLSWRDSSKTLSSYYTVQYMPGQRSGWSSARTLNVTRIENVRQTAEVTDLIPATTYSARVAAGYQGDLSYYSTAVQFTTTEEAPSSAPLGLQVERTETPGELRIRWLAPPRDTHNGIIGGYKIRFMPQTTEIKDSSDTNYKLVETSPHSFKQETVMSALLKGVRYGVSISAFNSAGFGPFSASVFQDTREGAPEDPPSSLECVAVSSTSLGVSWQPIAPHKQGGALIGYHVLYGTKGRFWQNATSLVTELRIQGLLKFCNYTIKVSGFSNYGVGPFSYPIACATLQDVPEAPSALKVLAQSASSLLVSWKKPDQPSGRILRYTVYAKPAASNDGSIPHRVEVNDDLKENTYIFELKGLNEGRQYDIWVTASTVIGEGAASRRATSSPSHRVVAGVVSLGGTVSVAVHSSLLLECRSVGAPPPRTVWYHNQNIITHHPRYTRDRHDNLLIDSIDQSLSGNYTCLAKNLYGSDSVLYLVKVVPLPNPPTIRTTSFKDSILVEWNEIRQTDNDTSAFEISYNLTWREGDGFWHEAMSTKESKIIGLHQHVLTGLKCGTKYSLRVTTTDNVGTSAPAHIDVSTLGGAPVPPQTNDWLWSNSSHIYIQLNGWDDAGCDISNWAVDYRPLGSHVWHRTENKLSHEVTTGWSYSGVNYGHAPSLRSVPTSWAVGSLVSAKWYEIRITATNDAGTSSAVYVYSTKTIDGDEIGPPSELLDLNMLVIVSSSILLIACIVTFICIFIRRHRQGYHTEYRHSIADDVKSRNESIASQSVDNPKDRYGSANAQRIYTSPIHTRKGDKNEMFEISPYAEFALGFRTFEHVENQDLPCRLPSRPRFNIETSFQARSESDDSDSASKATTVSAAPRKHCRTPHHR